MPPYSPGSLISQPWIGPGCFGMSLWATTATIAVVSSKYLFEQRNYHYPLRLLALQDFVALIIILFQHATPPWLVFSRFELTKDLLRCSQTWLIPSAILLGASFSLNIQAILHFPNLITLLMLTTLLSPLQSFFGAILGKRGIGKDDGILVAFSVFLGGLLLYDDYRLTVNGLVFGISALICDGIAKSLHACGKEKTGSPTQSQSCTPWQKIVILALLLSLPILAILSLMLESSEIVSGPVFAGIDRVLALNVITGAVTLVLGSSVDVPLGEPDDVSNTIASERPSLARLSSGFARSGMAACLLTYVCQREYTTWIQTLTYFTGLFALANGNALLAVIRRFTKNSTTGSIKANVGEQQSYPEQSNPMRSSFAMIQGGLDSTTEGQRANEGLNGSRMASILLIVLGFIGWTIYMYANFTNTPTESSKTPRPFLDTGYEAPAKFDIVISMYRESTASVSSVISRITQLEAMAKTSPRVLIYTKDDHADTPQLQQALGAFEVVKVPNQGRESETYLRHIIRNWDSLAEHTLFIQADIHNPREFYPRIQDYFKHNTGMLSLGFSGNTCDCQNCGDRWGWSDKSGVLLDIYQKANRKACGPMLLSYKGQFIASARRIRGIERQVYEDLHQAFVDPDSWAHQEKYLQGRPDSLNAPYFGYTMERLWSALLQCSDMDVAWKCSTLLSGTRRGGDAGDCQCFDEVAPN